MKKVNWLPFGEAHKIILKEAPKYGINTERKWQYRKKYSYIKPENIPHNPSKTYSGKGWISWSHWLGTKNIRGQIKKYTVNHDFFKTWSSDMAYVLGFWWADGYMRKRVGKNGYGFSYGFGICQASRDKYKLSRILKAMVANNPVWTPKSRVYMSHFEIISKTIYEDIINIGGVPNKSLVTRFPKVPKKYLRDFIRGLFDGDGCIYRNKRRGYCVSYICSGSLRFIEELKVIMDNNGFITRIDSNGNKPVPCMKLNFGINQTRRLGNFIYKNISDKIKLERKFELFKTAGEQNYAI